MTQTYINRIATAVPPYEVHSAFIDYAARMLDDRRVREIFLRMARLSAIRHRYSSLQIEPGDDRDAVNAYDVYRPGQFPSTGHRMKLFERFAPELMRSTLDKLALTVPELTGIRHVIVTSCTGFYAPGLDFDLIEYLGLSPSVERTMIGFMGCYAAINALKVGRHIVRSQPEDSVLVLNLELCTLHLQETQDLAEVLSFLIFGDGCAASLISSTPAGLAMDSFDAINIAGTRDLITWKVGDLGFDMMLSGRVPGAIGKALRTEQDRFHAGKPVDLWAIHPGGRTVLDAVQEGLDLNAGQLCASRNVLDRYGNMSSATIMFVLQELMQSAHAGQRGCAMSFGPGLIAETMAFRAI